MRTNSSGRSPVAPSRPVLSGMSGPRPGLTADGAGDVDGPESWGSLRRFMRLTGVDEVDGYYWIVTVWRPAHRVSHPFLSIKDCPGCLFEASVRAA